MNKNFFLIAIICTISLSCTNEILDENLIESSKTDNSIDFIYKGTYFSSDYTQSGDTIVWKNKEVGELYQKLCDLQDLATLVHENGVSEFFDNYEELPSGFKKQETVGLRATDVNTGHVYGSSHYTLYLYPDINYKGTPVVWNATQITSNHLQINYVQLPVLTPNTRPIPYISDAIPFNDVLSSFKLVFGYQYYDINRVLHKPTVNLFITLFQNTNYEGKSITFQISNTRELCVNDLRNYTMTSGFLGIGSKSWNDQVSSLKYSTPIIQEYW